MNLKEGGQVWFIEVKQKGKEPTELQQKRIDKLRAMGFRVDVIDEVPSKTKRI
jgi:hypothetical protein